MSDKPIPERHKIQYECLVGGGFTTPSPEYTSRVIEELGAAESFEWSSAAQDLERQVAQQAATIAGYERKIAHQEQELFVCGKRYRETASLYETQEQLLKTTTTNAAFDHAQQAATISQLEEKLRVALEPDMFWDADDPEKCEDSIREIVYERGLEVTEIATATHGPTFFAFLTGDDEKDPEIVHVFGTKAEAEAALASIPKEPA